MYVKIVGMQNEPEILIIDPAVYAFHIKEDKSCEVVIENEYLMVKTSSDIDQVSQLMSEMEKLKYDQNCDSPQDSVFFEAKEVVFVSQKQLVSQVTEAIKGISGKIEDIQSELSGIEGTISEFEIVVKELQRLVDAVYAI